jgi:hypothetical protein
MADRVLFVGWDEVARGAEERALEAFNEALGLLGTMQQDGRIEGFDVMLLEPNGSLGGFIVIRGTAEQIAGVRADSGFQRNTIKAQLAVDGVRHIEGYTNEGVAAQMAMYQEAIAEVPQRG